MNGGTRIIPIEQGQPEHGQPDEVLELADVAVEEGVEDNDLTADEAVASPRTGWLPPALAALTLAGWTAFFGWANAAAILPGGTPAEWSGWIVAWSAPALVILVAYLLFQRTSRREGARFADVAIAMNRESQALEERLRVLNGELSLARDFIAAQGRDLESLGRIAVDRLSGSAGRLATLVAENGDRVDAIGTVSHNALENMEKLRGQLPVIANAAKDVTNNIANAGRTAHVQLEGIVKGFQQLNEFGLASERQVQSVRDSVSGAVAELARQADQLGEIARTRFAAMASEGELHRQRLDQDEIAALAAIRARAAALSEELAAHRSVAEASEGVAIDALQARLASLRDESARTASDIAAHENGALAAWSERSAAHAASLREALAALTTDHQLAIEAATQRVSNFTGDARTLAATLREELDRLQGDMAHRRESAEAQAREAAEALARRLAEVDAGMDERRRAHSAAGEAATADLARRLAELDEIAAGQAQRQAEHAAAFAAQCSEIEARVAAFAATIEAAGGQSGEAGRQVDAALALLNQRLGESREALAGTDRHVAGLTDASVRLLELIQASSDHAGTHIPAAIGTAEAGLKGIEDRIFTLRETLAQAGDNGRDLSDYVIRTRDEANAAMEDMATLQARLIEKHGAQETRIAALRTGLGEVRGEAESLAEQVHGALRTAIGQLEETARGAVDGIEASAARQIEALAGKLGSDVQGAIAGVIEGRAAELCRSIEQAVGKAAESGRETMLQLRDQLAKVDELAGNLESRVTHARIRAEEQVDSDFARRVALITESLNSTAIDLAKVLSTEVTDTAWAAYLRGDRGIFTRRAVSLLDSSEARTVLVHYERDEHFRTHVNHYIHDFEAMLRQLLSTRDGNALGVTLLSSDMGKLYVALAQSIERLRT